MTRTHDTAQNRHSISWKLPQAAGNFTTLLAAAEAADLVDALKGAGPITVFAPTDEAFAKLPAGTVEALLADKDALTAILTYHVVPGAVTAAEVVKLTSAATLNGSNLTITVADDKVMIDNAVVTVTDIKATNGIIHVIDAVMIPATGSTRSGHRGGQCFTRERLGGQRDPKRSIELADQVPLTVHRLTPGRSSDSDHGSQGGRTSEHADVQRTVHPVWTD